MLCAVAFVVTVLIRIPIVAAAPFLKLDFKDVIIVIGGFIFGPLSAAMVSLVVSFLEMVSVSDNGVVGFAMNVLASCAFACTASAVYKRRRTAGVALAGLLQGCVAMTAVMLLWNYLIMPPYMGVERSEVAALLVPALLPFNLLKSGINAAVSILLYKPVVLALRRTGLVPAPEERGGSGKPMVGVLLVAGIVLVTCVLFALALKGIL